MFSICSPAERATSSEVLPRTLLNNICQGLVRPALKHQRASTLYLLNDKAPSRRCGELDNRGTHFYLALYWAQALAAQDDDPVLKEEFSSLADQLGSAEEEIISELNNVQGQEVDMGGYYRPDEEMANAAMRPSETLNAILDEGRG